MNFGDYAPTHSPSPDQQRDALRKGLGRAVQWAVAGQLDDQSLLEACLRDFRFDVQVEDSRGDWLWRMIQAVNAADRFRVPILHALYDLSDERSANQLCELARRYAEAGDQTFRSRLYEIVGQKPFDDSRWLGETEVVELDGEEGFLFAARVRGEQLAKREWDWDDNALVADASERLGPERVSRLLENTKDRAIASFREVWRQQEAATAARDRQEPYGDRMRAITVGEIVAAAGSADDQLILFRSWGRYADEKDLEVVLRHVRDTDEPKVIANLLQVFSHRTIPSFDARLIDLCGHGDREVRRRAYIALENVEHPLVRQFALDRLEKGLLDGLVAGLFINNYERGDEQRILEAMEYPADEVEGHWLLMDVVKVLEANPDADCSQLAVIAYALTPCETCRFHAAQLLHDRGEAPRWLIDECRDDSAERSRGLFEDTNGPTEVD